MSVAPAAKRARARALDAVVSTLAVPGLGILRSLFVQADGTYLVSTGGALQLLTPSGWRTLIAGSFDEEGGFEDGEGAAARFNNPVGITVDPAGCMVVVDSAYSALRRVSQAGEVSTLAGSGEPGFADGQGAAARFDEPYGVVVLPDSGEFVVSCDHGLLVVTPGGAVRILAGSGEAGFADGQGAAARFNGPAGLALDADGSSVLVADFNNHAVRRVTMAGAVSTVAGNGEAGFADGEGAAARFNDPADVVVDKEGTIVVADRGNHRLRKIAGGQVTTLAGGSEAGAADGAGAGARKASSCDERGAGGQARARARARRRRVDARRARAGRAPRPVDDPPTAQHHAGQVDAENHHQKKNALEAATLVEVACARHEPGQQHRQQRPLEIDRRTVVRRDRHDPAAATGTGQGML